MENMGLGQAFNVAFEEKMMYPDKEFHNVFLTVKAEINLSHPDRAGDETSAKYVTSIVKLELGEQLRRIGDTGVSYKDLMAYAPNIAGGCNAKLQEEGYTVNGFMISSIELDPALKDSILRMEQLKQMTPDDINRKLQEAQQATTQMAAEVPVQTSYPKFCTSCGTPTTGSKFCTNCGAKLG